VVKFAPRSQLDFGADEELGLEVPSDQRLANQPELYHHQFHLGRALGPQVQLLLELQVRHHLPLELLNHWGLALAPLAARPEHSLEPHCLEVVAALQHLALEATALPQSSKSMLQKAALLHVISPFKLSDKCLGALVGSYDALVLAIHFHKPLSGI
jgi:hypothetical protein